VLLYKYYINHTVSLLREPNVWVALCLLEKKMFSLANKVLFTLLMIQISLFCVLLLYLSSYYLTPSHGSDEKFRILVQKFRIKSPLCEHELPSQDHYKQEYGERVGNFLWRYVKRHREVE